MNIAILDEAYLLREALEKLIKGKKKFNVSFSCGSLDEFLNQLTSSIRKIDLIILDLKKSNMLDYSLLSKIKGHPSLGKIKLLIYSNFDNEMILERLACFHIKGYVSKSSKDKILLEALEAIYNGGTYFDECIHYKACQELWCKERCYLDLQQGEIDVLQCSVLFDNREQISLELNVNAKTITNRKVSIVNKLNVNNFSQAIVKAYFYGLIKVPKHKKIRKK